MRNTFKKTTLSLALATGLIGSAVWSSAAQACAVETYLSTVCIMATPNGYGNFGQTYAPAMGQQLGINQYTALYSIMGQTFGGSGQVSFNLPDLRGRVVVGSGTSPLTGTPYVAGQKNGSETVSLNLAQLPQHNHTLVGATVDISKMTATTTLSGLTTTTDLSKVTFTSSSSSLSIKALSTNGSSAAPSSTSYMAKSGLGTATVYTTSTPDTVMAPGSVVGTVSGTLSGTAPGTATGSASTTLGGTAGVSGATANAGSSAPVSLMQPYLVMNYYIAIQNAMYPTRD